MTPSYLETYKRVLVPAARAAAGDRSHLSGAPALLLDVQGSNDAAFVDLLIGDAPIKRLGCALVTRSAFVYVELAAEEKKGLLGTKVITSPYSRVLPWSEVRDVSLDPAFAVSSYRAGPVVSLTLSGGDVLRFFVTHCSPNQNVFEATLREFGLAHPWQVESGMGPEAPQEDGFYGAVRDDRTLIMYGIRDGNFWCRSSKGPTFARAAEILTAGDPEPLAQTDDGFYEIERTGAKLRFYSDASGRHWMCRQMPDEVQIDGNTPPFSYGMYRFIKRPDFNEVFEGETIFLGRPSAMPYIQGKDLIMRQLG